MRRLMDVTGGCPHSLVGGLGRSVGPESYVAPPPCVPFPLPLYQKCEVVPEWRRVVSWRHESLAVVPSWGAAMASAGTTALLAPTAGPPRSPSPRRPNSPHRRPHSPTALGKGATRGRPGNARFLLPSRHKRARAPHRGRFDPHDDRFAVRAGRAASVKAPPVPSERSPTGSAARFRSFHPTTPQSRDSPFLRGIQRASVHRSAALKGWRGARVRAGDASAWPTSLGHARGFTARRNAQRGAATGTRAYRHQGCRRPGRREAARGEGVRFGRLARVRPRDRARPRKKGHRSGRQTKRGPRRELRERWEEEGTIQVGCVRAQCPKGKRKGDAGGVALAQQFGRKGGTGLAPLDRGGQAERWTGTEGGERVRRRFSERQSRPRVGRRASSRQGSAKMGGKDGDRDRSGRANGARAGRRSGRAKGARASFSGSTSLAPGRRQERSGRTEASSEAR